MHSLEEIAEIPNEVLEDMLKAEAEVVVSAQKKKLAQLGLKHSTGQLERSISAGQKMKRDQVGIPALYIYPRGKRDRGTASNGEVGFILEYGAPGRGIRPLPWMRTANQESEKAAREAARNAYEKWLKNRGF